MMVGILGGIVDTRSLFETLASVSSAVALWASTRAAQDTPPASTPLDDLTQRLRQPVRWTLAHPVRAIRRAVRGR